MQEKGFEVECNEDGCQNGAATVRERVCISKQKGLAYARGSVPAVPKNRSLKLLQVAFFGEGRSRTVQIHSHGNGVPSGNLCDFLE